MAEESVDPLANARLTGYTRAGFAALYHAYRPRPPVAVLDLLMQLARTSRPGLVVDLGAGTGLSTVVWAARAERVIGIEPLDEMRELAAAKNTATSVLFEAGVAQATGLRDGAADIVTCAQSLHDMEPQTTLAEIARLLRPGGVFAAYDYDWPPVVHREAEEAFFCSSIESASCASATRSEARRSSGTRLATSDEDRQPGSLPGRPAIGQSAAAIQPIPQERRSLGAQSRAGHSCGSGPWR